MTRRPCLQCGADTDRTSIQLDGSEVAGGYLCRSCFELAWAEFLERRRQFAALLGAGVDRDEANRIMIARGDGAAVKV